MSSSIKLVSSKASDGYIGENIQADGNENTYIKVDEAPKFDLESYIANYKGRTRFDRLFLIGKCSTILSADALRLAVGEAKSGKDVERYVQAVQALSQVAPNDPDAVLDQRWVDITRQAVRAETDKLEHELKGYKNNLIKESIRMGTDDLASHYHSIGDLAAASKAYARLKDNCTTPSHFAAMHLKTINVAIDRGDWFGVQQAVARYRSGPKPEDEHSKSAPKISSASGLAQLGQGNYLEAANQLLNADPTLGDTYNEVLTANDVAVYGGLCALASMDRNELQRRVLENSQFRNYLELEPHIRRAISAFCNSKFRACLDILEEYRADYLLDIHLQRHIPALYNRIRTKSIQQYALPFSRVSLEAMAKVFAPEIVGGVASPTDISSPFVQELIKLIENGTLDARIDLEKGLLVSKQMDLRREVIKEALESAEEYVNEAHLRLIRTNLINAGLEIRVAPSALTTEEATGRTPWS
ncbi:COP9 signalosome subunit 1 (CsnA), putative [Talaromyces stipitatus ATCC 10500]|uniref:COP9 signalosome complex subunit 1 n=1 Tax=Talaromyces stipitatus (strain ATCC 10500 / CBS 375.48 / QM 6759 / NRRL 1006) TaxID=441959 RepID=B8ME31_TALSN|nr:COP9 signalosome subunit 1 (CsnA), putative [Talaromyces stipitatus ATCC 10500]EED16108.1 COP9 signalosome subunit 1 (CsnA), putative [Talaromyces stipitatus ATCC 10500]